MGDFAISAFIHGKTRKSNCLRRATISYKAEFGAYTPTTPQFPSRGKNNVISNPKYNVFAYKKAKVDLVKLPLTPTLPILQGKMVQFI